ncbi:hypothetical protein [Clostridioides difficile]|nr:hypothetical protein [Clostridioides difficile]
MDIIQPIKKDKVDIKKIASKSIEIFNSITFICNIYIPFYMDAIYIL